MRMSGRRLQRIERQFEAIAPLPEKCPCCGDVGPVTRSGPIWGGFILDMGEGEIWFWCKVCSRSFWAKTRDDGDGQLMVSEAGERPGIPDPI
jgi:hypothetical protein